MRRRRSFLVLTLLSLGIVLWTVDHRHLQRRRTRLEAQALESARILEEAADQQSEADRLRRALETERLAAADVTARSAASTSRSDASGSDTRWGVPPATLPDWNTASPYVWIQKSLLSGIPVTPFEDAGSLQPGLGAVLALEPEHERRLNAALTRLVAEVRTAEAAGAALSAEALAGIAEQAGEKLTLQVPGQSDVTARLRSEAESALKAELGAARSELVLHWGKTWLDEQFGSPEAEAKIYSVVRHPDDTYGLSIKTGGSWMSVGGVSSFMDYIPIHLRAWFEPLRNSPPTAGTGRP